MGDGSQGDGCETDHRETGVDRFQTFPGGNQAGGAHGGVLLHAAASDQLPCWKPSQLRLVPSIRPGSFQAAAAGAAAGFKPSAPAERLRGAFTREKLTSSTAETPEEHQDP